MIFGVNGPIGSGKSEITRIIQYISDTYAVSKGSPHFSEEDFLAWKQGTWRDGTAPVGVFTEKKFADKLKDCVCLLLGCTRADLEDTTFKNHELGEEWWCYAMYNTVVSYVDVLPQNRYRMEPYLIKMTPRILMQRFGTEGVRNNLHKDSWVNATLRGYRPYALIGDITITDVAHPDYPIMAYPKWVISDMRFPNEMAAIQKQKGGFTIRITSDVTRGTDGSVIPYVEGSHESEIALKDATFDYYIVNNEGRSLQSLIDEVKDIMQHANAKLLS